MPQIVFKEGTDIENVQRAVIVLDDYAEIRTKGVMLALLGDGVDGTEFQAWDVLWKRQAEAKREVGTHLRFKILARDKFRCVLCGYGVNDGRKLHVDHNYPKSRGGACTEDNLQTLCSECNIGKSNKIIDDN